MTENKRYILQRPISFSFIKTNAWMIWNEKKMFMLIKFFYEFSELN